MVTSAIATPALPAVNDRRASTRCRFLCQDNKSMEITPKIPETVKEAKKSSYYVSEAISEALVYLLGITDM